MVSDKDIEARGDAEPRKFSFPYITQSTDISVAVKWGHRAKKNAFDTADAILSIKVGVRVTLLTGTTLFGANTPLGVKTK